MFEKIIKSAKIYNEVSVTHNKFEKFRYYEIPVRYNDSIVFVTVNVGKGINDGKYHIYDLTEPKERNTPNRINGFVRPVGNAVGKGVPTVIICFENKVVKINVVKHKLTICPQKMEEDIPDEKSFSRLAQRPICLLRKRYVFR